MEYKLSLNFAGWMFIISLIVIMTVCIISIMFAYQYVFGATEEECLDLRTSELIKIHSSYYGNCDWLVNKFLWNGSDFKIASHSMYSDVSGSSGQYGGSTGTTMYEYWVLTRK